MNPLLRSVIAGRITIENPITILTYDGEDTILNRYPRKLFSTTTIFRNSDGKASYSATLNKGFVPSKIVKIDRGAFLDTFLFFEATTVHYLSIKCSDDLWGYICSQQEFTKTNSNLAKRLDWVAQECKNKKHEIRIKRIKDLLFLRNQVAHNLEPKYLLYNKKIYEPNDTELVSAICEIMWEGMTAICDELLIVQTTLESWLALETKNAPRQVIIMADGKRIVDGVKEDASL